MEKKLNILFDFQKLRGNERLEKLINEVGSDARELSLDELGLVNAAGDIFDKKEPEKITINGGIVDEHRKHQYK